MKLTTNNPKRSKTTREKRPLVKSIISEKRITKQSITQNELLSFLTPDKDPRPFTKIAFLLGIGAMIVMMVLYLVHKDIPEDRAWSQYALYMFTFAAMGLFGTQMIYNQTLIPLRTADFRPMQSVDGNIQGGLNTGLRAVIIVITSFAIQGISKTVLTFTSNEQKYYFVAAAVAEELFFRVVIISGVLKFQEKEEEHRKKQRQTEKSYGWGITLMIVNLIQSAAFAAIHQNYYHNLPMLISVFIAGLIFGLYFIWWRDPTANILGHFLLNLFAIQNL